MFCMKCGNQFPDGSTACPICGAPVAGVPEQPVAVQPAAPVEGQPVAPVAGQPMAQQPYAQPYAQPRQSSFTYDIGGFFSHFFKNPIEACTSRDQKKHFLLGITFPSAYLLFELIFQLIFKGDSRDLDAAQVVNITNFWTNIGISKKYSILVGVSDSGTGRAFATFFTLLFSVVVALLIVFALSGLFRVKKTDFLSTFSWTGLAFMPMAVTSFLGWILIKIYVAADSSVIFNLSNMFTAAGLLFFFIVLYDYFYEKRTEKGSKTSALLFALTTCAVFEFSKVFFGFCINKMFF